MSVKKIMIGLAVLCSAFFWAQGCYFDKSVLLEIEETREISFAQDMVPIFNESCNTSGCHSQGAIAPDLSAGNAFNSLSNGNYLNTEAPESSELYQWLSGKRSAQMPLSGPDPKINAVVLAWIKQGARNN